MLLPLCNHLPSCTTVFLFLLFTTVLNLHSLTDKPPAAAAATCNPDDEAALLAFKSGITSDPSGMLQSWTSGTNCCNWNGITCLVDNRVGTISLTGQLPNSRLSGTISSSIGQLTQVSQLRLRQNLLTGTIPLSIQNLKNLTLLQLDQNQLTGTIPDFFTAWNNLRILNLTHNKFTGKIPQSISALAPTLRYLELGHNFLTGQIPDFMGKFRALDTLDLSWNNFSGVVPKTFSNLTKIFNLDLSHNHLVDPFPTMYVKGIESLDLSYNQFHLANIPSWVTSSPIIYSLKLAKCGLKLKLDDWNPAETYFYDYIDLSENQITGSPFRILNRTDYLVGFYTSGNQLQFNLETLKFPKTLKFLDLSRNMVKGRVPSAVSGLEKLNVSHNHLCGQLPKTKFPDSAFAGNDCLCGSPLPPCKKG